MKTKYNSSNYGNDLRLTLSDARACTHSGDCTGDVKRVAQKPYVLKQTAQFDPEKLAKELKEYGAWNSEQLADHKENIIRWVWLSAGDITERA